MPKSKLTFTIFLVFLFFIVKAQNEALKFIDQNDLKEHLTYLASDELLGRKLGADDEGLEKAAEYIAGFAQQIGLKPGVENYFQQLDLISETPSDSNFIEIKNRKGKSVYHRNAIINWNDSGSDNFPGAKEIILAGFGDDNLESLDLKNKIVIIAQGNKKSFHQKDNIHWNNHFEKTKFRELAGINPAAIILVTNPHDKQNKIYMQLSAWRNRTRFQFESKKTNDKIPVFITSHDFGDALLGHKGSFEKYLAATKTQQIPPVKQVEEKSIKWNVKFKTKPVNAKNIIGVVEGSDPELKNECVVIMAHYDHLGVDKNGDVFNGADDNGSGTVTVMEVAQAIAKMKQKPKRSIVFLWVTGEEFGLFGSQFYAENPVFPLNKTVACINIDMDGRVYEPRDSVWKNSPKKVKDFNGLFTLTNNLWPALKEINTELCDSLGFIADYSLPDNFLRTSDHFSFHNKGVPILNYATGYHADYHKATDEVSKINFDKMKRVADLCFLVANEIANRDSINFNHHSKPGK